MHYNNIVLTLHIPTGIVNGGEKTSIAKQHCVNDVKNGGSTVDDKPRLAVSGPLAGTGACELRKLQAQAAEYSFVLRRRANLPINNLFDSQL